MEFLQLPRAVQADTTHHFIHFVPSFGHVEFSDVNVVCSLGCLMAADRAKSCLGFHAMAAVLIRIESKARSNSVHGQSDKLHLHLPALIVFLLV